MIYPCSTFHAPSWDISLTNFLKQKTKMSAVVLGYILLEHFRSHICILSHSCYGTSQRDPQANTSFVRAWATQFRATTILFLTTVRIKMMTSGWALIKQHSPKFRKYKTGSKVNFLFLCGKEGMREWEYNLILEWKQHGKVNLRKKHFCGTKYNKKNYQYFQIFNSICFALLHYKQHLHLINTIGTSFKTQKYYWTSFILKYYILSRKRIWYIRLLCRKTAVAFLSLIRHINCITDKLKSGVFSWR